MTMIDIPALSLVVLVGVSGSGKSTFARQHFGSHETLSSDMFRGLVAGDELDQSATRDAFEALYAVAALRLKRGLLTVIDATSVQPADRKGLVALARDHDVLPVAIVLDIPESLALERNERRSDRTIPDAAVRRQHQQLRRGMRNLAKEGFRKVHVLRGEAEIADVTIERTRLLTDRSDEQGPFDVIGDVHGCRAELESLLEKLGYELVSDEQGRSVDAHHPEHRRVIFLGDLVDRGPDSPGVLRLVMGMVSSGNALAVPGNHEAKLVRALRGARVSPTHGLAETLAQLSAESEQFRDDVAEFCYGLVSHLILDDGKLVVAHAGLKEQYHGRASGRVREFALYGDTTGETDEYGLPVRYPWAEDYRGSAVVLYGHTPVPRVEWVNGTACLDTGCVFGGALSAMRYPEREVVAVPAERVWYEPVRPLREEETEARPAVARELQDVYGKQIVDTHHHGRITISAEQSAGALETMSRWAIDPRWLLYLPPTMSPPDASRAAGFLEHPQEAFAYFSSQGVTELICEEKHMGSRAVILASRSPERFAAPTQWRGAITTRTGRAFFEAAEEARILAQIHAACEAAGIWQELDTDWVLLDAEILPWSLKAEGLIRDLYAATATSGDALFTSVESRLSLAQSRGIDVGQLQQRTRERHENLIRFRDAYRRYVGNPAAVRIAPFQFLAGEHGSYETNDHGWHLGLADRLVSASPELFQTTRRVSVSLGEAESERAATSWWTSLTEQGGEGMVVKPFQNLIRGQRGLVQPGIKVRGREYLRLIYGPDYTGEEQLARLRERDTRRKRARAAREYALGLEALRRVTQGEPLWRIHQAVFAVLALESEPIDPRL